MAFHVGIEDLNSDLQACKASTLPTEAPPYPCLLPHFSSHCLYPHKLTFSVTNILNYIVDPLNYFVQDTICFV